MFNRYKLSAAAAALLVLSAPAAVYAQQTTAALRGVVTDPSGAPVANAKVTVIHTPSGTRSVIRTDTAGNYEATGLKVGGPYEVDVDASDQSSSKTTGIYLNLGDQQKLDIALQNGPTMVTVVGKRATLSNPGSRTTMRRDAIEGVVTIKRDLREVARRDPLTQLDPETRGTGPSGGMYIAGSAPRANRITIDGVRSSDDFGLNTGGLSTNLGPISLEAIEQMTVQAVPADVEEGDFTGGALNLVLRSGTNKFHGSIFETFRDKAWNQNQLYHPDTGAISKLKLFVPDKNYGVFLSGPILKNRLFFAVSYEDFTSAIVSPSGLANQGFGSTLTNGGQPFTQAQLDALLAPWSGYAASAKLAPGNIPLTTPFKDEKYSLKLDWNIMDGQRASFTYRHAYSFLWKGQPTGTNNLWLNTDWYTQPENEDNYAYQLNSKWNDKFSTEARLAIRNYQRGQTPPEGQGFSTIEVCSDATSSGINNASTPSSACTTGNLTAQFGPDQFRQANVLKTTDNALSLVGTYADKGHSIKGGYQAKLIHVYNLFDQQANGVYYFDSQADFSSAKVDELQYTNNPTGDVSKTAARFHYINSDLFAQDTFDIFPNTTLNYGLRYDMWNMPNKPALNPNFTARNGFSNQGTYDGLNVLEPRIGLKWHNDAFDASGSFGLYTGGLPDVFLSNRFGNTGILTASFTLIRNVDSNGNTTGFTETNSGTTFAATDATATALMNINKSDANFAQGISPTLTGNLLSLNPALVRVANTNSLVPNFKMPSDWKFNFAGHWHTPFYGVTLGIDGVLVKSNTGLAFRDLRARPLTVNGVQQYTPDGRMRYDGLVVAATSGTTLDTKNQSIYAARQALGLDVAKNADGTPDYDLANPGGGYDIQAYNPAIQSTSSTVALSIQDSFDGHWISKADHLDLSAAFTHQDTNQYGGLPEFATTDCCGGSNYNDQYALEDPNAPTKGHSSYEIRNGMKFNVNYKAEFFQDSPTSITLFGDLHEGRPVNFYVGDAASGRGQTFGVVSTNELAFIPQTTTPDATNPLKFITGTVPVYFKTAADLANLQKLVAQFNLPTGIQSKGTHRNPDVKRWDLHVQQDVKMPWFEGHRLTATMDIQNLGNLLNKKWGNVAEYGDGRAGTPIYKIACTDANGAVAASNNAVCAGYQISSVSTTFGVPTVNQYASLYSVMFGLKYAF